MSRSFHEERKGDKFLAIRGTTLTLDGDQVFIDLGNASIFASPLAEGMNCKPLPKESKSLESGFFTVHSDGYCYVGQWSGNSSGIDCAVLIVEVKKDGTIEQRHRNNRRTALKRDWPDSSGKRAVILEQGELDVDTWRVAILFENTNIVRITDSQGQREYHWTGGPKREDKRMQSTTLGDKKHRKSRKASKPALAAV